jgi:hypothetical protein
MEGKAPVPSASLRLLWMVRSHAYAKKVLQTDLRHDLPEGLTLELEIYVTGLEGQEISPLLDASHMDRSYGSDSSIGSRGSSQKERIRYRETTRPAGMTVTFHTGRPRMSEALDATLEDMLYTSRRLAVQTCGPEGMMEDLRAALVERYGVGKRDVWEGQVDLWEDGFVW